MRKTSSALLAKYRIDKENMGHVYGNSIQGFAVSLTDEQYQSISPDPTVLAIEPDCEIALAPPPGKGPRNGGGGGGSTAQKNTIWNH